MWENQQLQQFLDNAQVEQEVFDLRPDYRVLLIALDGITNSSSDSGSEHYLQEAASTARNVLAKTPVTEIPHIASWRETYKAFGAKPTKFRNSLESLTRRVEGGLPRVNRLTDIYNAISVKYQIPLGVEDLDKYDGSPVLKRATGKEDFETTNAGAPVVEHPEVGEVVWCDGAGVTCRRWNWRQGTRTALSEETRSVVVIMDALQPFSDQGLETVADELVAAFRQSSSEVRVARRIIGISKALS